MGQEAADEWHRSAERAEKYLTYLATYLHEHGERDLVWWRMSRRLLSRPTGFALGVAVGLAAAALTVGVQYVMGIDRDLDSAILAGLGCALLAVLTWYAAPDRPPGRLSLRRYGSLRRLCTGFTTSLKLTAIVAVPVSVVYAAGVTAFSLDWSEPTVMSYFRFVAGAAGVVLAISVALAAHAWLDAPPEHSAKASPVGLLRQDRTSSLAGAVAAGAVLGVTVAPLAILGSSVAVIELSRLMYGRVASSSTSFITGKIADKYDSTEAGVALTLIPAVMFFLVVLLTRAWPRFCSFVWCLLRKETTQAPHVVSLRRSGPATAASVLRRLPVPSHPTSGTTRKTLTGFRSWPC
ncbi:hypothetical protein NKH18_00845 [Streptomyces sp. M10(2022)]